MDNNQVTPDDSKQGHEILQALYDFRATFAKTLSFREGDLFVLHHGHTKQRNWWQVVNEKGQVGYVPSNYVATIQVGLERWHQFVENCLAVLKQEQAQSGGSLPHDRQELLKLLTGSDSALQHNGSTDGRIASPIPGKEVAAKVAEQAATATMEGAVAEVLAATVREMNSFQLQETSTAEETVVKTLAVAMEKGDGQSVSPVHEHERVRQSARRTTSSPVLNEKHGSLVEVDPKIAYQLVEQVRVQTQLSYDLSRVAVTTVVSGLCPLVEATCRPKLRSLLAAVQGPLSAPRAVLAETHDAYRLRVIFSELTSCKNDSQQRSWSLHEDEAVICDYLDELINILKNADVAVSQLMLSADRYQSVLTLVEFCQMEVRWSIRQRLLRAFGLVCGLDAGALSLILNSVLPSELARYMKSSSYNVPCLTLCAVLLSMLFSMGEAMPVTHLEHLGQEFVLFLSNIVENPPETDVEEKLPDLMVNVLLSYNLQFSSSNENILLKALSELPVAKTFTEKILFLLNREEDPVRVFEHQPAPPHSVLKLFKDLFSLEVTAALFYTNDVKVLIDIIVRQLADLSPGEKRRHQYLQLCRLVMRNTAYEQHHHRLDDIRKCFTRIFCEESDLSCDDQQLVRDISNEFPQYFKA
ncbi:NCK-interacting protein with SH3 domain-like isoform X2 [Schistocerca cancellata]|uniref:NCK-interacting protein with SH3 domain-like isoform X2 n=1 Tax=Schistocerca cancellata TaxID=274614 RepID=UPI002118899E|nr:NCK-interacting protein with SH3 domain-like isoform X2 [Schistocerca cancellata]